MKTQPTVKPAGSRLVSLALAGILLVIAYVGFPVLSHAIVFEYLIPHYPSAVVTTLVGWAGWSAVKRYPIRGESGMVALLATYAVTVLLALVGSSLLVSGARSFLLAQEAAYEPTDAMPRVSNARVRYTPLDVAEQHIARRTQTSQSAIGAVRPVATAQGVAYVTPLEVRGVWNMFFGKNQDFMFFDDAGTDETRGRVHELKTDPFQVGEGMEVFDDIQRTLVVSMGFFRSYPEISYVPVYDGDALTEVLGIVPYISYHMRWGITVPHWGGVVVFHADGTFEDLTPEQAQDDPRLQGGNRLFPEALAEAYAEAQRFDAGPISGYFRRDDKIEIPELPGGNQMPFYLPMEDGSYQYVTMAEPDGASYALRKIFYVNAQTGKRSVYAFDGEGEENLLGPAKVVSSAKSVPGYNWYEESGQTASGSYRIVEPRPVTRDGKLYYMLSVTPIDYGNVVATVFVDASTSTTVGPFKTRAETFAWLAGDELTFGSSAAKVVVENADGAAPDVCENLVAVCEQIETVCPSPAPTVEPVTEPATP